MLIGQPVGLRDEAQVAEIGDAQKKLQPDRAQEHDAGLERDRSHE